VGEPRSIAEVLRDQPFTAGLRPEHLELLAGCAKNVHLAPGYVHREGDPADLFYLLREGAVALEVHSPARGGLVVQTIHAGEVLGWSWLFAPHRWTFDARVVEPTRAIAFDGACLRGKCDQDHELGYALMRRVAQVFTGRLAATRIQLLDLYGAKHE
jgi:CRP-like cAMP-binding protein